MVFRKDHRPEVLSSDHMEGEDKEVIIFLLRLAAHATKSQENGPREQREG